jgi:hypothetical protein
MNASCQVLRGAGMARDDIHPAIRSWRLIRSEAHMPLEPAPLYLPLSAMGEQ